MINDNDMIMINDDIMMLYDTNDDTNDVHM